MIKSPFSSLCRKAIRPAARGAVTGELADGRRRRILDVSLADDYAAAPATNTAY